MDDILKLKQQHARLTAQYGSIHKELRKLNSKELELEESVVKLTSLALEARMTPLYLKKKRKDLIKYNILTILLFTFFITSIVACRGYNLETGFKINEIITALIASSAISTVSLSGLSFYAYTSYNKSLVHENPEELQIKLENSKKELDAIVDKIILKNKELRDLEKLIGEIEQQMCSERVPTTKTISQQHIETSIPESSISEISFQKSKKFPS